MIGAIVAAVPLVFTAVLLAVPTAHRAAVRLGRLRLRPPAPRSVDARRVLRLALPPLLGLAVAVVISGWPGLLAGAVAGIVVDQVLRRTVPRATRELRARAAAELPFALDLLASALRSGVPPGQAALAVGGALGGPLGDRFDQAGRALVLGGAASAAWTAFDDVPGGPRLAAAASRGTESGAAQARALLRLADDLRSARLSDMEANAHRSGVLVVLPLGLCFLPAFVIAGLIPVVASMLGTVLP
ncbi:MAG TPA: type II secretion system F family protein [Actinocatenispora sp.]